MDAEGCHIHRIRHLRVKCNKADSDSDIETTVMLCEAILMITLQRNLNKH